MKCPTCEREWPDGATVCDSCGAAAAVTGLTDETPPQDAPAEVVPPAEVKQEPEPASTRARGPRGADLWRPTKERVRRWLEGASSYEVSHYEVLELAEGAGEDQLALRVAALGATLEQWSYNMDADLQHLGKGGKRELSRLKED